MCPNKMYETGKNVINQVLALDDVNDDEKTVSAYYLYEVLKSYCNPFYTVLNDKQLNKELGDIWLSLFPEIANQNNVWTPFNDKICQFVITDKPNKVELRFEQRYCLELVADLEANVFFWEPLIWDNKACQNIDLDRKKAQYLIDSFQDRILNIFYILDSYYDHKLFLGKGWDVDENIQIDFGNNETISGSMKIKPLGEIDINLRIASGGVIDHEILKARWSDGRPSLEELLENNQDKLLLKMPISVGRIDKDVRKIYLSSFSNFSQLFGYSKRK